MSKKKSKGDSDGGALGIVLIVLGVLFLVGGLAGLIEVYVASSALPGMIGPGAYAIPGGGLVAGIGLVAGGAYSRS